MATFKFYTKVCEYGVMTVEADSEAEAKDKVYSFDGDYFVNKSEFVNIELFEHPRKMVADHLTELLHQRMTEQELNVKLTDIFGREIAVEQGQYDEDWQGDDYYTFSVDDAYIGGYFDIYYIKMNKQDNFYITEVNYLFE